MDSNQSSEEEYDNEAEEMEDEIDVNLNGSQHDEYDVEQESNDSVIQVNAEPNISLDFSISKEANTFLQVINQDKKVFEYKEQEVMNFDDKLKLEVNNLQKKIFEKSYELLKCTK